MSDEKDIPDLSASLEPLEDVDLPGEEPLAQSVSLSNRGHQPPGARTGSSLTEPASRPGQPQNERPANEQPANQQPASEAKPKTPTKKSKKKKPDPLIGKVLNNTYLIERKVGEGGMGNVYAATQSPLDRQVAIKILKPSETNQEGEHYFMREVRAINMLRHPNIINVIDFGKSSEDGALFLVMEFLPGRTLERVIKKEYPLAPERICQVAIQVLSALESAHQAGIVHCDLKPANIMLEQVAGQDDFVKVLDFGIAKVKDSGLEVGPYTQKGNIVGTFDYMSPEQILRKDLDGRSDLWSLGVIMYEMLTRKRLFHDKDAVSIIGRVMQMPVQPPSVFLEGVPDVLDHIVLKAMERNRGERFESAAQMRQALQQVLRWLEENPGGQRVVRGAGLAFDSSASDSRSGSLSQSGLVRSDSGAHGRSRSGAHDSGVSALLKRSGSFSEPTSGDLYGRSGTQAAPGTSILDQTFSVEELKGSLLGEKRKVAVLAVRQRARAAEGMDPREITLRSQAEKELISEVVEHFDGEVDSFLGGTYTILFGARRARVGDNLRAIECALALQTRFRQLPHGAEHLGMAVVYGEVSLPRSAGANAYGAAIDRAVAVSTVAKNGAVYADEAIAEATRARVDFDAPRRVRDIEAAEILKLRRGPLAAHSDAQKELVELDLFVPRPHVFEQLSRLAADVEKNRGTSVALLGEMGVGKTRFLANFVEIRQKTGDWQAFLVAEDARQQPQSLAAPRSWIRQIADTYRDPVELLKKACQSLGLTQNIDDVAAFFMAEGAEPADLELPWTSQQEFSHFCAALLHKMLRFALRKGPLLLALDDISVSDRVLVDFLDALNTRIQKLPVMLLLTRQIAATTRDHGLPGNFEILEMHGFSREESRQFVAQIMGQTPPMAVVEQLHMRSSGNPVYLHELVRAVRRTHGQEGLMDPEVLAGAGVPQSLHELLAERVDTLDHELRDLLRLASVLGESFREDWFFQITPSHLNPAENLKILVEHQMITARFDAAGRVSLAFHPRALRKIVYERLPAQARVDIHARVIEFLEHSPEAAAVDPIDIPLMLAFHYRSVNGFEGAAYYMGEGGAMLLDQYDYAAAIGHFEEALKLLDQAQAPADAEVRVSVQTRLLLALRESGRIEDAQRVVDDLGELSELPNPVRAALLYEIGMTAMESGGIERSLSAFEALLELAIAAEDPKTEVRALLALSQLHEKQDQLGRAAEILMDVSQKVDRLGQLDLTDPEDRKLYWTAYNQLGTLFVRQKDFQKAQQFLNAALNRAQQISDHRGLTRALSNLGALCLSMRDIKRAQSYFDNAFKAARGVGDLLNQSRILTNMGIAAMQANQLEASKDYLRRARAIAEEIGWYEGLAELAIHIQRLKKALG